MNDGSCEIIDEALPSGRNENANNNDDSDNGNFGDQDDDDEISSSGPIF
jgi:hypothetical protein